MHDGRAIELRLLGSLSARVSPGREAGAVLAQPKRFALLAYLAAAPPAPHGFHRRDSLLALFWPDADQEHARTSLRKALHFLRQELGADLIQGRGDEEVGLVPERCWCDTVAFEEAVAAGRWEEAIDLYRGDLLAGFHLSDAAEFERWVDESRVRHRERAAQAAWSLAQAAAAEEHPTAAARWARRATALSPYDEPGLRRLVTLLDRAGDRAGAVMAYEEFAQRLAADLEVEPSQETVGLVESIRRRNGPPLAPASVPGSLPAPGPARDPVPASVETSAAPLPRRRRSSPIALGLSILVAGSAVGAIVWRERPPREAPASSAVIAVLPFEYRGSPALSYVADGMVDLLSTKLDGAAGLRTVDPQALRNFAGRVRGPADPERGRLAARRFGAGRFVLGRVVEASGRLWVTATIFDGDGTPHGSVETTAGDAAGIFDMADGLAEHLLAKAQDTPLALARVADQTTSSLPALEAYIEGERELRADRRGPASEAFQRAAELDSAFALAWYRLAMLAPTSTQARDLLARALRHGSRLGEHQRRLIEAKLAFVRGEHKLAEQLYRHILADHPDDVEAWNNLGWIILTKGHLLGLAWVDAREPLEHVLRLDPQSGGPFFLLGFIAAREGRRGDLDSLTERFLRLEPASEFAGDVRGQRAIVFGDTLGLERFVADLRSRPDLRAQRGAGLVTHTTMNLEAGRRLWSLIAEPSRSPGFRALAHVILAKIELTNGRERAAKAELERAMALDALSTFEHRVYYALIPYLETPRSELLALRDSLTRWPVGKSPAGGDGLANLHRSVHPYLRLYLLGLLSARLGDEGLARHYATMLEQVDSSAPQGFFANDLAPLVRSEIARARGRVPEALATLEQASFWTRHSASDESGDSPVTIRMHERWARAELLYQLKRYDEALAWYRTFIYDFVYTGPAHFRTAQIAEVRGERQKAIEHYTRFIELWRDCDPAVLPMRQQAEAALARLRAQRLPRSTSGKGGPASARSALPAGTLRRAGASRRDCWCRPRSPCAERGFGSNARRAQASAWRRLASSSTTGSRS